VGGGKNRDYFPSVLIVVPDLHFNNHVSSHFSPPVQDVPRIGEVDRPLASVCARLAGSNVILTYLSVHPKIAFRQATAAGPACGRTRLTDAVICPCLIGPKDLTRRSKPGAVCDAANAGSDKLDAAGVISSHARH
jgi:hypothetical protein